MVVEDEALKYQTTYEQVSKAIMKLKDIGIDITKLEEELNKINKRVKDDINNNIDILNGNFGIELYYQNGIRDLNKLSNIIESYDFYYQIDSLIKLMDIRIKDSSNMQEDELNNYIAKIKIYLSKIKTSSTIIYENEELLINKLYEITYYLIKQEILSKDESDLLEYIKSSNTDTSKIDSIIRRELNNSKYLEDKKINVKYLELESNGINSNCVNLDLLRLIVRKEFQNKIAITEETKEKEYYCNHNIKLEYYVRLGEKANIIDSKRQTINELKEDYSSRKEGSKNIKNNLKKYRIKIGTKIVSVVLVLSSITSLGVVGIKKLFDEEKYKTTTTTYIEGEDTPIKEEEYKEKNDSQIRIILEEKDPYASKDTYTYERDIRIYDLTDVKKDEIEDYFTMNLDDRIPIIIYDYNNIADISIEEFYTKTLRQLIIESQDLEDSKVVTAGWIAVLLSLIYLAVWLFTYAIIVLIKDSLDIFNLYRIKEYLKELKKYKQIYENYEYISKEKSKEIEKMLKENKRLISIFNKTYQSAINEIGETEELRELYNLVNDVILFEEEKQDSIEIPSKSFKRVKEKH